MPETQVTDHDVTALGARLLRWPHSVARSERSVGGRVGISDVVRSDHYWVYVQVAAWVDKRRAVLDREVVQRDVEDDAGRATVGRGVVRVRRERAVRVHALLRRAREGAVRGVRHECGLRPEQRRADAHGMTLVYRSGLAVLDGEASRWKRVLF